MNNDKTVSPDIERLAPGLTREWLCDRRIIVFNFKDVSRETVDACVRGIRETIEHWPLGQQYLCAYDLQFPQAALTAYLRERLKEVMEMYRDRGGSTAIIIQRTFMANLAQFFLNTQKQGIRVRRIFFSREEGLDWLKDVLRQNTGG